MSYIITIFIIKIIGLVLLVNSSIINWNLKASATNLLINKPFYEKLVYNETKNGKNIFILKVIYRNKNQVSNVTKININNQIQIETNEFENIQTFYYLRDYYYICFKEKYLYYSKISSHTVFEAVITDIPNTTNERNLKCNYINGDNRIFFVFLNSYKNNLLYLKYIDDNRWAMASSTPHQEFYDYFVYSHINSTVIYLNMILLDKDHISLYNMIIDSISLSSNKTTDLIYNAYYYSHRSLYFYKETKIFYFILYNTVSDFTSGYSLKEIGENVNDNKNIPIFTNSESPLKIFGESKINYLKFIRNTRLAYYEIETNDKILYHGILDIKLNKIIYNTNDNIIYFSPLTNYSMLAITNYSAYEICPFTQDGKCIEECEEGQELLINYEKGNYCGKTTSTSIPTSDDFNYMLWIPIIAGAILLLLTLIILIIYIKRRKINENNKKNNDNQIVLFKSSNTKEVD